MVAGAGRLLVAGGSYQSGGEGRLFVARFLPGGAPDSSFGEAGIAFLEQFKAERDVERV